MSSSSSLNTSSMHPADSSTSLVDKEQNAAKVANKDTEIVDSSSNNVNNKPQSANPTGFQQLVSIQVNPTNRPLPNKLDNRAPKRTTKTSQKLTFFPSTSTTTSKSDLKGISPIPNLPHVSAKSLEEEWLSKLEKKWLPRCTAYCTANSYDFPKLIEFLRNRSSTHLTDPKRFDEVIHTPYFVPEQQIGAARSTWLNDQYILDYINNVPGSIEYLQPLLRQRKKISHLYYNKNNSQHHLNNQRFSINNKLNKSNASTNKTQFKNSYSPHRNVDHQHLNDDSFVNLEEEETITIQGLENFFDQNIDANGEKLPTTIPHSHLAKRIAPVGECLFFDYGVVVMWGLSWEEEQIVLNDISQFEEQKLSTSDVEVEEFHFHYNAFYQPRIYNDIITLKNPQNYMIRLTISHAIAQSVKLVLFEGLVDDTIDSMRHVPLILAETGKIHMTRKQVNKKIAQLFIMRINVNLVSNVLDTPEIFWSEPALDPLYRAIRGYLEIPQRVDVLNQRVTVISDMLDMLKDNQTNTHGEHLEWIIIILIGIEIIIGLATTSIDLLSYKKGISI